MVFFWNSLKLEVFVWNDGKMSLHDDDDDDDDVNMSN